METNKEEAEMIMGIDEAGRGPVLGAMVYGAAWCAKENLDKLGKLGFADSKVLTEQQREDLFTKLKATDYIGWSVDVISPQVLSAKMLRKRKYNLNAISHDSAIGLIQQALDKGINLSHVYLDTVGDSTKYEEKLSMIFPHVKFTVSKKADSLYPVVSAASIVAKVTRDKSLMEWKFSEEAEGKIITRDFGSGYPGDERTKTWLRNNIDPIFGFPDIVRFSWATTKKILEESGKMVDWGEKDDDEDEEIGFDGATKKKQPKLGQFFGAKNAPAPVIRCTLFKSYDLQVVAEQDFPF